MNHILPIKVASYKVWNFVPYHAPEDIEGVIYLLHCIPANPELIHKFQDITIIMMALLSLFGGFICLRFVKVLCAVCKYSYKVVIYGFQTCHENLPKYCY